MRRVVITGIGAVTPLGNTFQESWSALKKGTNGIGPLVAKSPSQNICIAGALRDFEPLRYLKEKEINRLDPFVQYAVAAASMAFQDAFGRGSDPDRMNTAVVIGSSRGGVTTLNNSLKKRYGQRSNKVASSRVFSPYLMPSTTISMAASYTAQTLGLRGYCLGISNACASGANAIGEAYRLIKDGYATAALAGGTEAPLCEVCIEGYYVSGALTRSIETDASKPFDIGRDGFVLSEGACILVLEEYGRAMARGAHLYGEIAGYGYRTDGFDQVRPHSHGEAEAMASALRESGLRTEEVDCINSHGTSTPSGDRTESSAIEMLFGERTSSLPVIANKSMTGHMLAASGSFEVAATACMIEEGIIPPTINLTEQDHLCRVRVVTEAVKTEMRVALSNSFGFGGVNAVIVLKSNP